MTFNNNIAALEEQLIQTEDKKDKINIMNQLSLGLMHIDQNRSIDISNEVIKLAGSENFSDAPYQKGIIYAKTYLSNTYMLTGDYEKATLLTNELFPIVENNEEYSDAYIFLLVVYGSLLDQASEFADALETLLKAYSLAEELKYAELQAVAAETTALLYDQQNEFDKSQYYYRKALILRPDDIKWRAHVNNNMAMTCISERDYCTALKHAEESLRLSEKYKINGLLPYVIDTVGTVYKYQEKYDAALILFKRAVETAVSTGDEVSRFHALLNIGNVYNIKDDDRALEYLTEAFKLAEEIGTKTDTYNCLRELSGYYERKEDYKKSLDYYKRYKQIESEVIENHNDSRIHALNIINETKQLRKSISEKEIIIKEIHHRIKNNLNMVTSLIALKSAEMAPGIDLSDLKNQINAIGLVHDKLYRNDNFTEINFKKYILELLETIFHSISGLNVEIKETIEEHQLPSKLTTSLGLIVNEIAINAVKHAFTPAGRNVFSIEFRKNGEYFLKLENNCGGNAKSSEKTMPEDSLGLRLIRALIEQIGGKLQIEKAENFIVEICIPVQQL